MQTIEEIKTAINMLPPEKYTQLKNWFLEKDWEEWDQKIAEDSQAGKPDFLISEALLLSDWQKRELDKRYEEYKTGKQNLRDWRSVHEDLINKYK